MSIRTFLAVLTGILLSALAVSCSDDTPTQPKSTVSTPNVSSLLPPGASAGITVKLTGSGFGDSRGSGSILLGTTSAAIVSWSSTEINFTMSNFSPGSGLRVIVTNNSGKSDTTYMNITPPNTYQVTLADYMDQQPCWGPGGDWIYFISSRAESNWEIWRIPAIGGTAERVTHDPASDFQPCIRWSSGELAWSSDRNHSGQNAENELEIFTGFPLCPTPGSTCTIIMATSNDSRDVNPAWAGTVYNGYDMAYTYEQTDVYGYFVAWKIMLHSATGTVELTEGKTPAFSGDGQWIVYSHNDNIYKIPTGGGSPVQLTSYGHDSNPHWNFANDKIVFQRFDVDQGNADDIYIMDSDGSNLQPLVSTRDNEYWPRWSSDGSKVVYHALVSGRYNIYVCVVP